jgi:hypothetical protein
MNILTISGVECPKCNNDVLEVTTERTTTEVLNFGDIVTCTTCHNEGLIDEDGTVSLPSAKMTNEQVDQVNTAFANLSNMGSHRKSDSIIAPHFDILNKAIPLSIELSITGADIEQPQEHCSAIENRLLEMDNKVNTSVPQKHTITRDVAQGFMLLSMYLTDVYMLVCEPTVLWADIFTEKEA